MHQTSKPQVLPRTSLLKNKNSSENINSTNPDSNNSLKIVKPAIPEKPPIALKPSLVQNENKKSITIKDPSNLPTLVPNLTNHYSTLTAKIENISKKNTNAQQQQTKTTLPINKSSKEKSTKLTKFLISSTDLNRLRFRKDFDDKNVDTKGNFLIYDVREDEEQINKMNEICELLVAGGYFRARIKGLHNFDKIIGGMCWAIQMCNIDLNIDIFYQEDLSIGQKIALTEKIVRVLQKMKCPFKLEPHQIQGMDCIHIYPTIQWLVKKSLETRQQTADYIRSYSTWQFNRIYNYDDSFCNSVIFNDDELIDPIKTNLQRRFLHPSRSKLKDERIRVNTTLLEYGVIGSGFDQRVLSPSSTIENNLNPPSESQNVSNRKPRSSLDTKTMEDLLDSMKETEELKSGNFIKVPTCIVGRIVSEQSEEIKRLAEGYERNKTFSATHIEFHREEAKLKNELLIKRKELNKLLQNSNVERLSSIKEKLKIIEAKSKDLKELEKNENEEVRLEKIHLTELLNVLRKQKSELKQHCREEKQRLEKQIEMIEVRQVNSNQLKDKLKEINQELKTYEERHSNIKKELSLLNKRYAMIQRKFDDIPNRTELAQYQKRFLELYNQLSTKHNETKKFYILYNTLSDERMYLEKEFNLVNSILENFQKASISNLMIKDEFLVKFQQTVDSIIQNKNKIEQKLQSEKEKRDQLNAEYCRLIEEQRLYFIAVKAFKEECKINEQLIVQLNKIK